MSTTPLSSRLHAALTTLSGLIGRVVLGVVAALALWLPGLVWYAAALPDTVEDPTSPTDAIVVLTGGSERLHTGLELLREGRAEALFVSGVYRDTDLDALLRDEGVVEPALRKRIIIGHVATDTVGNAIETAVWMRETRRQSLRLVTAAYHMPRSLLEFRAALPEVRVVPHPVFPSHVKQESWWQFPGTAALLATEYTKYLVARLRLLLPDAPQPPRVEDPPSS